MATILILSLAVVLAASVFLFVTTYPQAPVPQQNAFALNFTYGGSTCVLNCGGGGGGGDFVPLVHVAFGGGGGGGGGQVNTTGIEDLHITLVGGPSITGATIQQSSVRLASQQKPYSFTTPFSLPSGLSGGSPSWGLGQTWTINLSSYHLPWYDNLTISVLASGKIVLDTVSPGTLPVLLPELSSCGVSPAQPLTNQSFTVYCTAEFPMSPAATNPVEVNLTQVPGSGSTKLAPMTNSTSNPELWTYTEGPTGALGTFSIYVVATDRPGHVSTLVLTVTVV